VEVGWLLGFSLPLGREKLSAALLAVDEAVSTTFLFCTGPGSDLSGRASAVGLLAAAAGFCSGSIGFACEGVYIPSVFLTAGVSCLETGAVSPGAVAGFGFESVCLACAGAGLSPVSLRAGVSCLETDAVPLAGLIRGSAGLVSAGVFFSSVFSIADLPCEV
jgi:hypothetical protein